MYLKRKDWVGGGGSSEIPVLSSASKHEFTGVISWRDEQRPHFSDSINDLAQSMRVMGNRSGLA